MRAERISWTGDNPQKGLDEIRRNGLPLSQKENLMQTRPEMIFFGPTIWLDCSKITTAPGVKFPENRREDHHGNCRESPGLLAPQFCHPPIPTGVCLEFAIQVSVSFYFRSTYRNILIQYDLPGTYRALSACTGETPITASLNCDESGGPWLPAARGYTLNTPMGP